MTVGTGNFLSLALHLIHRTQLAGTLQLLELGVGEPMVQGDWEACGASKQCIESGELLQ